MENSTRNSFSAYHLEKDDVLKQLTKDLHKARISGSQSLNQNMSSFSFAQNPKCTRSRTSSDLKQIPLLRQRLNSIIRSFTKCEESAQKFLKVYPDWNRSRQRSISKLNEVADALDKTRFDCNVAKVTGASVGVAGGVLGIVGAALIPFTLGISTPIMIAGTVTAVTGATTGLGGTITELIIVKNKVKEAQNILKVDEKTFKCMKDWFQHSESYTDAVKEFMDFDMFAKIIRDIKELFPRFLPDLKIKHQNVSDSNVFMSVTLKCLNIAAKCVGAPVSSISLIVEIPELFIMLQLLMRMHYKNRILFESVAATAKFYTQILKGTTVGLNVFSTTSAVARTGAMAVQASLPRAICLGILSSIGLAIEITSIVLTSIDLHEGSKCPTAQNIRNVKEKLQEELYILQDVHKSFKK